MCKPGVSCKICKFKIKIHLFLYPSYTPTNVFGGRILWLKASIMNTHLWQNLSDEHKLQTELYVHVKLNYTTDMVKINLKNSHFIALTD